MNRRELFKSLAGAVTLLGVSFGARAKHGLLTVGGHRVHKHLTGEDLHVWVDGVDVTDRCYEADDVQGYACVFCRDQQDHKDWTKKGHIHRGDRGGVCQFRLTGHVVIGPKDA